MNLTNTGYEILRISTMLHTIHRGGSRGVEGEASFEEFRARIE